MCYELVYIEVLHVKTIQIVSVVREKNYIFFLTKSRENPFLRVFFCGKTCTASPLFYYRLGFLI